MEPRGLIDTGALLALLDRDDRWHSACVAAFERARLPLATTTAVLAEPCHLLRGGRRELAAAWQLLRCGAIRVVPLDDDDLANLQILMERYHDRPMDFADATLVHIGSELGLSDILTIDQNDFETNRMAGRRKFRITPARASRR
jgi:hypothetical protein